MAAKKTVKAVDRMKLKIQAMSKELVELASEVEAFIKEEESESTAHDAFLDHQMSKLTNRIRELEGSIDRLLRLKDVLEIIPTKKSNWWAGVKSGRYPAPVYTLGPKLPTWKLSSILQLVNGGGNHE